MSAVATASAADLALLATARRAVLATINERGTARLVPIAFAADELAHGLVVYSALDEKAKSVSDPRELGRVRDIAQRPRVTVLVDEWSEDWTRLRWLRLEGEATLLEPAGASRAEHGRAVELLRARYAQYATHALEARPIIRITVDSVVGWSA